MIGRLRAYGILTVAALTWAACGDDKDDDKKPPAEDPTSLAAACRATVELGPWLHAQAPACFDAPAPTSNPTAEQATCVTDLAGCSQLGINALFAYVDCVKATVPVCTDEVAWTAANEACEATAGGVLATACPGQESTVPP